MCLRVGTSGVGTGQGGASWYGIPGADVLKGVRLTQGANLVGVSPNND